MAIASKSSDEEPRGQAPHPQGENWLESSRWLLAEVVLLLLALKWVGDWEVILASLMFGLALAVAIHNFRASRGAKRWLTATGLILAISVTAWIAMRGLAADGWFW